MSNSSARTMRRNASISGSTSTKSNSKARGFTAPSLSARLLPCVRVTVRYFGSAISITPASAAVAVVALRDREGVLHPCGRKIRLAHFHERLEHLEVVALRPVLELRDGLARREAGERRLALADLHGGIRGEREALAHPLLEPGARREELRLPAQRTQDRILARGWLRARADALQLRPAPQCAHGPRLLPGHERRMDHVGH